MVDCAGLTCTEICDIQGVGAIGLEGDSYLLNVVFLERTIRRMNSTVMPLPSTCICT
jgi:hypothetical protein